MSPFAAVVAHPDLAVHVRNIGVYCSLILEMYLLAIFQKSEQFQL